MVPKIWDQKGPRILGTTHIMKIAQGFLTPAICVDWKTTTEASIRVSHVAGILRGLWLPKPLTGFPKMIGCFLGDVCYLVDTATFFFRMWRGAAVRKMQNSHHEAAVVGLVCGLFSQLQSLWVIDYITALGIQGYNGTLILGTTVPMYRELC